MAQTLGCTFPCYQLNRLNCISAIVTFLKATVHLLPTVTSASDINYEIAGLQAARETAIRLCYQTGISNYLVDAMRWNKEAVYSNAEIEEYLELRAFRLLSPHINRAHLIAIERDVVALGNDMC